MPAKKTDRILALVICLCVILALAIIFRSFLWTNLLQPIAVVFWLVWRVIASVNQKFYWGVVIAAALFLVIRLFPKDLPQPREDSGSDTLNQDNGFFPWHAAFTSACSSVYELEHLRKRILDLYVSVAHQTDRIDLKEAEEMVKSRQIPLSEAGRSILLPEKGKRRPFSIMLKIRVALLRAALGKGRGTKLPEIIHDPIDEMLTLMEDKAEINHE
jgi:hypothetical protein